jgi:hypothetical protein
MRTITTFAAVISVLMSLSLVRAVDARNDSTNGLEGICKDRGGTFSSANHNGVHACVLPDGAIIVCGGALKGCETIAPRVSRPGHHNDGAIGAILATEQRILANLANVLAGLDNLKNKMADVQTACLPPDLVPVPEPGSTPPNFCQIDQQNTSNLLVRVQNQGLTDAGPSTVRVTFSTPSGPVVTDVPTPALAGGGGSVDLSVPIPPECYLPANPFPSPCNFQIAVDIFDDVKVENSETNNNVSGACVPVL